MQSKLRRAVHKLLKHHYELGIEHYPRSKDLEHFLASKVTKPQSGVIKTPPRPSSATPDQNSEPTLEFKTLADIRKEIGDCSRCKLHQNRANLVFGAGNENADLVIVGEWPDWEDDSSNTPFSGAKGELLEKMLHAIHLSKNDVYLANIVKCRASEEHPPGHDDICTCLPFLRNQITVIHPKIVCTMGPLAAQAMLTTNKPLLRLRGRIHDYKGIPLIPTFHPSYLLKTPEMKKAAWIDLQMIQQKLKVK